MANILLGITSGIAAYKAYDLINKLKSKNEIKVIITENAKNLISIKTLEALSKNRVLCNMWDTSQEKIEHIDLTQEWADIFLIVPATANIIGKMANGIADDFLSTAYLASPGPVVIAPAMNTTMWLSQAVQRNIATLKSDGIKIIDPISGRLACNSSGIGKLAKLDDILEIIKNEMELSLK